MQQIYEAEDKQIEKEMNMWASIYMTFNDDNEVHMDNAFHNNGLTELTAVELRNENRDFLNEVMSHGVSKEEICKILPETKEYLGNK